MARQDIPLGTPPTGGQHDNVMQGSHQNGGSNIQAPIPQGSNAGGSNHQLHHYQMQQTSAPQGGHAAGVNHHLQDYQMQLMLLEQQDKQRQLQVHQEKADAELCATGPNVPKNEYDLNLLCVCRQIYREACLLPYKLNLFSFASHSAYRAFMCLRKPCQLRSINALVVDWHFTKRQARDLSGLKTLYLRKGHLPWNYEIKEVDQWDGVTAKIIPWLH